MICPPKHTKEWSDLVKVVGEFEATRDWMDNGNIVRAPEEVKVKLSGTPDTISPEPTPLAQFKKTVGLTRSEIAGENIRKIKFARIKYNKEHGTNYEVLFHPIGQSNQFTFTITGDEPNPPGEQGTLRFYRETNPNLADTSVQDTARANEIAWKVITQLTRGSNVKVLQVDSSGALEATKGAKNPWNGEPVFTLGDTIYVVTDKLTTNMAFHEFAHPVLRSMWTNESTHDTFRKMYDNLALTAEGKTIIAEVTAAYADYLAPDTDMFKEEVLVRALADRATNLYNKTNNTPGFIEAIKRVLYHIKQWFRKMFKGPIKPENLDVTTTLDELANMLVNDHFTIDTTRISQEEFANYMRETEKMLDELHGNGLDKKMQPMLQRLYDVTWEDAVKIMSNKELPELFKLVQSEFGEDELKAMRHNLNQYRKVITDKITDKIEQEKSLNEQSRSFIKSLYQIEGITKRMLEEMNDIVKSPRTKEDVLRTQYINNFGTYFRNVLSDAKNQLSDLPQDSALRSLLQGVINNIEETVKHSDSIIKEGMSLLITDILEYQSKKVEEILDNIKKLRAQGIKESVIKDYERLYDRLKVTPETIKEMMSGMGGDANKISSIMEGWLYNPDPIVGGLGVLYKNTMNTVNNNWMRTFTDFLKSVGDLAKAAGIDLKSNRVDDLAKKVTFIDYKGGWNDKGEFVKTPVHTFINPHKDYKWVLADINHRVKEAETKYEETNTQEDLDNLAKLKVEQNHWESHMTREFNDSYYEKNEIFNSEIGQKAKIKLIELFRQRDDIIEKAHNEIDRLALAPEINEANKNIRQLYSLSNQDGTPKDPDSESYQIAQVLLTARTFNRYVYDYNLIPGRIQSKFLEFQDDLVSKLHLDPSSDEFEKKTREWINENTVRALTPEFYDKKKRIQDNIKEVYESVSARLSSRIDKGTADDWEKDALKISEGITDTYDKLWKTLSAHRDEDNQPQGPAMKDEVLKTIKEHEVEIERLKKLKDDLLTTDEKNTLAGLKEQRMEDPGSLTDEDWNTIEELEFKGSGGMTVGEKIELSGYFSKMTELQNKVPTSYYLDTINDYLRNFDMEKGKEIRDRISSVISNREPKEKDTEKNIELFDKIKSLVGLNELELTAENSDHVINILAKSWLDEKDHSRGSLWDALLASVPGFDEWYRRNHFVKQVWSKEHFKKMPVISRTAAWSIIEPTDINDSERTYLRDINGNIVKDSDYGGVDGKPSFRFYKREVKDSFKTGYDEITKEVKPVLGKDVDVFGHWLPRSKSQGAPSDAFMNEQYERIRQDEPELFKLITEINKQYLEAQKGADRKLGHEFPRIRIQTGLFPNLEVIQRGKSGNIAKTYWDGIKAFFQKVADDPALGNNPETEAVKQQMLLNEELYHNPDKIVVNGSYDIPIDDVSMDMFHGVAQYFGGIERQKELSKILPFFEATHNVLSDPRNAIRDVTRKNMLTRYLTTAKGGKNIRAQAIKNHMDRNFLGYTNTGIFKDNKGIQAVINAMFKGASFSYLAWQIPSAITNATVQMTQNFIRAASGQQFTIGEMMAGSIWASKASTIMASEIYRSTPNSVTVQLIHLFDPIPGLAEQKIGTSPGRTLLRDIVGLSWLYSPRKFMENYATLQAFGAIMKHEKITRVVDGKETTIEYLNAWELVDNKIQLKSGIDPTYAPAGKEFNRILNMIQHVQHDMNGAYDNFSQPEAYRDIIYRMFAFLRKYVTTMITNRFAVARRAPGMMDIRTGFYTSTVQTLWKLLKDPRMFKNLTADEIGAAKQFVTELSIVFLMYMMYGLFGWDPNDEDKYEKLREKSGPLPLPFVSPTENEFQVDGWLSNHMLLQLLKLKSQTEMWIPYPGLGLKDYTSLASAAPAALGPTIEQYAKMLDTLIKLASGDSRAYYQRSIGPYDWQQEGFPKLYNYLMQIYGFRGPTAEPVLGIMKQEQSKVLQ